VVTGSIQALRTNEFFSNDQQKAVSKVLMANASFEKGEQSNGIQNNVTRRSSAVSNMLEFGRHHELHNWERNY